mgnify:CR=1 FL=1
MPASLEPLAKLDQDFEKLKNQLDQKKLDKVYKFMDKNNNDNATCIMENLVGIFKGTEKAEIRTVELYLRKIE